MSVERSDTKACQATPAATLEQRIMDPNIPKSEAEWWASREIDRLTARVDELLVANTREVEALRAESERLTAEKNEIDTARADAERQYKRERWRCPHHGNVLDPTEPVFECGCDPKQIEADVTLGANLRKVTDRDQLTEIRMPTEMYPTVSLDIGLHSVTHYDADSLDAAMQAAADAATRIDGGGE